MTAVLRESVAVPAAELSDAELTAEVVALRQLADAAEAAYVARLGEFDRRGVSERDALLSTKAWARRALRAAPGETGRALRTAKGLRDLPAVAAALADGRVRPAHAAAIVDGATLLGGEVIDECADVLLEAAAAGEPSRLRAALRGYGAAVDNPRAVREAERRAEGRWLDLASTFDGAVAVHGMLGAEDGALVKAAVDALSAPAGGDDDRSPTQRRADALVEVCRRQITGTPIPDMGLPAAADSIPSGRPDGHAESAAPAEQRPRSPRVAGSAVSLVVVTDLATLERRAGGFGRLPDGAVLRGETVRRLACDASITRVITGPASQPLDVGRSRRAATAAQRTALRIRDGGCRFPGCDRPPEWTDVHHVIAWASGGATDVDAMVLLCRKHHTAVHEGGWRIRTSGPGQFVFVNPRGRHDVSAEDHTGRVVERFIRRLTSARARPPDGAGDAEQHDAA